MGSGAGHNHGPSMVFRVGGQGVAPEPHETGGAVTLGHDSYLCYITWP
jgi:hypothetical protein